MQWSMGATISAQRFLVADCSWIEGVPLISAAAVGFQGQLLVVIPGADNPCYRCLIPERRPDQRIASCHQAGTWSGCRSHGKPSRGGSGEIVLGHDPDMATASWLMTLFDAGSSTGERVRELIASGVRKVARQYRFDQKRAQFVFGKAVALVLLWSVRSARLTQTCAATRNNPMYLPKGAVSQVPVPVLTFGWF